MKIISFLIVLIVLQISVIAQYAPQVGVQGTTAIRADSSAIVGWATTCVITRGFVNVSDTTLGYVTNGDSSLALGKALSNGVVSLGDGGVAICTFANPINNGASYDFVVFENSFNDTFLELALVEVSSDGVNYVRFNATSLTDTSTQQNNAANINATQLNNLAGKYRGGYGTPFDLEELKNAPNINVNAIKYVKLIDVVGSINTLYGTKDSEGRLINDPYPTPYATGGFDLDAIGVLHNTALALTIVGSNVSNIYPNPVATNGILHISNETPNKLQLVNIFGQVITTAYNSSSLSLANVPVGTYSLQINTPQGITNKRVVVCNN